MIRPGTVLLALLLAAPAAAARPTLPEVSEDKLTKVQEGQVILQAVHDDEDSTWATLTGLVEIEATEDEIWSIITSADHTVAASKAMKECIVHRDDEVAPGHRQLEVTYRVQAGLEKVEYHVLRDYFPTERYLQWVIDQSKDNDIAWTEGTYSTHPGSDDDHLLLLYTSRVDTGRKLPKWLEEDLTNSSLKRYLKYVKTTAEAG